MPKSQRQSDTAFAIVLFTDMVGSTAIASELGDRRWRVLQAKHHSVIRSELRKHGGREIDTAGDGFFAAFHEGEAAIRCACAIRDAVMDIGLQVRCGVNVGQVEMNDGKPTGAAVVAAARIMSKAGDGEVLVSNVLRELIPGSKIEFADAGTHELKGLDGSWHLFRIVAVDGPPLAATPPAEELTARRTSTADSMVSEASSVSRTRKLLAGAAAFLVLAAGIAILRSQNDAGLSTIAPNSIGILDPESGDVTGTIGLEERPGSVAASADAVWVTNPDAGTVTQIDPTEQEVRDSIQVGENPTGIAVGEDAVWVVNSGGPSVSRISPGTNEVVDTIEVGNGPAGIAVGEGFVWVTNRFDGTISRLDPNGGRDVKTIPVGVDPRGIVVGFGSVWVGLAGSNTVVRVNPETGAVTPIGVGNGPGSLALGDEAVLVANSLDDTVSRINPETNKVVTTIGVGKGPSGIAFLQGVAWVTNEADGTLSRIEPDQTTGSLAIGSVPQGLAGVNGDLWVSVRGTATSHRGGTLRVVSIEPPPSLDPGFAYDGYSWRVQHLLGDGLVAFEPVGGTNPTLVDDLATSLPTPTEGGRTYTFRLRPGIRYSSGEVVAPADFRRAIERAFRLQDSVRSLFGRLVGGEACGEEPGACDLSEGIVTDDATGEITFHLIAPDPEFLYKLTLNFAYPVPPSVPDEHQRFQGVPGTGPYMLEAPMTDEGLTLVRNPNFRVWSRAAQPDGYVDRIEWTFGVQPRDQVEAVAASDADVANDPEVSGQLQELLVGFASQVYSTPMAWTEYLVLDTEVPPFDDVEVRRALNSAIDRGRLAKIYGGAGAASPTCQQLPPNFPGYEPYCPYSVDSGPERSGLWTAPRLDLEEARRIIRSSGTAGMRVVFEYTPDVLPQGSVLGDYMVELLESLGYRGSVKSVSFRELYSVGNKFQMVASGWIADYPAASSFIVDKLDCGASVTPVSGFCDPRLDAMIERAIRLRAEDPAASGALWAKIDRLSVDQAPFVWTVNPFDVDLVSERVGNYQWHAQWGGLLNQLWVR